MAVFDASDLGPAWELYEHARVEDNDCEDRVYQFGSSEWALWIIASRALSQVGDVIVAATLSSLDQKFASRSTAIPEEAQPTAPPSAEARWYHDPTPRAPTGCTVVFHQGSQAAAAMTLRPIGPSAPDAPLSTVLEELSRLADIFADVLIRAGRAAEGVEATP